MLANGEKTDLSGANQYIRKTLELALPSISINGLDASPSILTPGEPNAHSDPSIIDPNDPSYEPYDTRLAQKLRDRYAALEEETTRVAELRHEAPVTAADAYIEQLTREIAEGERVLEARKEAVDNLPGVTLDEISYKSPDVQESLDRGRAGLEALRNVTKVKAVLERAREAVAEVEKG